MAELAGRHGGEPPERRVRLLEVFQGPLAQHRQGSQRLARHDGTRVDALEVTSPSRRVAHRVADQVGQPGEERAFARFGRTDLEIVVVPVVGLCLHGCAFRRQ
jgi:hypothetical protein